jgi:hypothetical protein
LFELHHLAVLVVLPGLLGLLDSPAVIGCTQCTHAFCTLERDKFRVKARQASLSIESWTGGFKSQVHKLLWRGGSSTLKS